MHKAQLVGLCYSCPSSANAGGCSRPPRFLGTRVVFRSINAFAPAETVGCTLPDKLKAILLEDGVGLTGQTLENYMTLSGGKLEFDAMRSALMKLDTRRTESVPRLGSCQWQRRPWIMALGAGACTPWPRTRPWHRRP